MCRDLIMKKTTKLRILKALEVFLYSFWNSIALSIALRLIIDSTNIKIEKPILYMVGCLFIMIVIEIIFLRFKDVLKDTFYEDMEEIEKNNLLKH